MSSPRNTSISSTSTDGRRSSSFSGALKSLGHHIAQHNRDVQAAYAAYYGITSYPRNSATTPALARSSSETERTLVHDDDCEDAASASFEKQMKTESRGKQQSRTARAWKQLKQQAREHHEGVNAAYRVYYGAS